MKRCNLPDTDYLKITKAASELGCKVEDIIHWAANQKTTLYLMLEESECAVIVRNLDPAQPNDAFDKQMGAQDRLVNATLKITQGEFGLARLHFNDVRPSKLFGGVPMFYRFSYGGVTYPLTLMAKASGLWTVGHSFAKQLETHGMVEFRSFFVTHGYLLTLNNPIDGFQVSIVPITSAKNPEVPDCRVFPEHLWLTHESVKQLFSNTARHSSRSGITALNKHPRYSPKKHAMLIFLTELLVEHDDVLATIAVDRDTFTSSHYHQLVIELRHALQCPDKELVKQLIKRCAHTSAGFLFLANRPFEEWSNTAIAEAIQTLMCSRPRDQIQSQLANVDKNTIRDWLN
ncbi:hypothetical protein [Aeromonas sp. 603404]|uniref:hypothetical protein n=1 Tax=Aeromonas sp. 603404 TaxID=2712047 RepID=UPI003B9F6696